MRNDLVPITKDGDESMWLCRSVTAPRCGPDGAGLDPAEWHEGCGRYYLKREES